MDMGLWLFCILTSFRIKLWGLQAVRLDYGKMRSVLQISAMQNFNCLIFTFRHNCS